MHISSSRFAGASPVVVAIALSTVLSFSAPASADDNNQARVAINANFTPASPPQDIIVQHPGLCTAAASGFGGFSSTGSADARADSGYAVMNGAAYGSLSSQSFGIFRDSLTITAPGVAHATPGTVTFSVTLTGTLSSTSGSAYSYWSIVGDIGGGTTDMSHSAYMYSPALHNPQYVGDAFGTFTAVGSFQYGLPSPLYVELHAINNVGYDQNGAGAASYQHLALNWGGLSGFTANGQPVPGGDGAVTIASQSGTNWHGGITAPADCPADLGSQGGVPGPDGTLDNNDFIVFINEFFDQNPAADLGVQGGGAGHDGLFDNNDFIAFITLFFAGC
jgi:hypothetical protein